MMSAMPSGVEAANGFCHSLAQMPQLVTAQEDTGDKKDEEMAQTVPQGTSPAQAAAVSPGQALAAPGPGPDPLAGPALHAAVPAAKQASAGAATPMASLPSSTFDEVSSSPWLSLCVRACVCVCLCVCVSLIRACLWHMWVYLHFVAHTFPSTSHAVKQLQRRHCKDMHVALC